MPTVPDYVPDAEMMAKLSQVTHLSDYKETADLLWEEMGTTPRYKTGWPIFDHYIGEGFGSEHRGELVVIAGETGVGKSTLAVNLGLRLMSSLNGNPKLDFISLENPFEDIYNTMRGVKGGEDLAVIRDQLFFPSQELIFGGTAWRSEDLMGHMDYVAGAYGVKIFIIDHLNFMFENESQAEKEAFRIRAIMRKLSRFCMNHKALVFAISHVNRNRSANDQGRLSNDRIYGSGSIAAAATKVLLMDEADTPLDEDQSKRIMNVRLTKSRYTRIDKSSFVRFDATNYHWKEIDRWRS